jgi:hypothetical protein
MKLRRVRFVWGAAEEARGRWYLGLVGLFDRTESRRHRELAISVRGALQWSGALLVAAYLAGATALFWIWQRNPYSVLSYSDALFYPFRRGEIEARKGQAFITQGTDLFRAKKYTDAATLLRMGLARYPRDIAGRLLLAQFYQLANQRPAAMTLLEEGLPKEYPGRAYLEALFNAAQSGEDYGKIIQVAERYRAQLRAPEMPRDNRWLLSRLFSALYESGHFTEALALAEEEPPGDLAREHQILALVALRRLDQAFAVTDTWQATPGADQRTVLRLRIRVLREAKRGPEMETAIGALRAMNPSDPAPLVYGVIQCAMAGDGAAAAAALQDYIFRFGGSAQNLILVAEPLAEIGQLDLLKQCTAAAAERGFPLQRFQVVTTQLLLERGEWTAANAQLDAIPPANGRDAALGQVWHAWMDRLLEVVTSPADSAQISLLEFFRQRPWPLQMFKRSVTILERADRLETARDLVAIAGRVYPAATWAQEEGTKVAGQLAAREAATAVAVEAPAAGPRLPSEAIFIEQLNGALGAAKWAEANRLIREARTARPAPSWVAAREPSFLLAQVRIGWGSGDRAGMLRSTRLLLNGDQVRSQQVLEAAQEFFRGGDKESATAVAKEVLARTPNFPPAVRLLASWEPKAPAAAPINKGQGASNK